MSQHDYVIDNASGATVRADINSALSAIQSLNSGTSAPSSTAAGMLWLDTTGGAPYVLKVRDAGNNHWLTLGNVTDPGADGNLELLPGKINLPSSGGVYESDGSTEILTESSGAVSLKNTIINSNNVFPAGTVLQVGTDVVTETNSITNSYVNYYEVSITLKSSSSDVIIIFSYDYHTNADNEGHGLKVYRGNSATVTTSDSLIYDKSPGDATGPLIGYGPLGNHYLRQNFNFKDSLSGFSVGNTLYYGFFFRKRSSNATVEIPTNQEQDGSFHTVLMEVQK